MSSLILSISSWCFLTSAFNLCSANSRFILSNLRLVFKSVFKAIKRTIGVSKNQSEIGLKTAVKKIAQIIQSNVAEPNLTDV